MRRKHHDLLAWQAAMRLVETVYAFTTSPLSRDEAFNLTSQMRRAAVSVPSNIAEGAARMTAKEFGHFLGIARGSLSELETQYLLVCRLKLAEPSKLMEDGLNEVFGLLGGLIRSQTRAD
ncbi:four helix bundle protein [Chitinilyticum litopenaei]|uniref:four helix bundle protein n=1 Tax=Chitinilyticum litopenaei TaxID=1121276 RepID=UPI00041DB1FC|nr:four helix bundle protein [Chitinilyticum litopenaei]